MASLALAGSRSATARAPDGTWRRISRRVPRSIDAAACSGVSHSTMSTVPPASASAG